MTLKVRPGLPSLRTVALVRVLECTFAAVRDRRDFRLVHYSVQDTHAHLVVEAEDADALGRGMMAVASRLARAVNRVFGRSGPVLRERFHLHVLRTPREVRAALAYVLLNARRHARRIVGAARIDLASSGRRFDGWRHCSHDPDVGHVVPIARARTWLLALGWRRHGLLDPAEVPGRRGRAARSHSRTA